MNLSVSNIYQLVFALVLIAFTAVAGESPLPPLTVNPPTPPAVAPTNSPAFAVQPAQLPAAQSTAGSEPADVQDMTNSAYLLTLAEVHLQFGAVDRAEPLLRTALEKAKDGGQKIAISQALGQTLERKGDYKGAAEQFEAAYSGSANPPDKARVGLLLADMYLRAGDPDKAQAIALDVGKQPETSRFDEQSLQQKVLQLLSRIWRAKPALLDAYLADAEAALIKDPNDAVLVQRLSDIYTTIKQDPAKAAAYSEKLAQLHPDDKMAQYRLAASYQQSRHFDKAIELYKRLMAIPGERKEEVQSQAFQVGMLTLQAGKKDEAVAWMKENFIKDLTLSRDYFMAAMFFEQAGMTPEAIDALNKQAELAKSPDEKLEARTRLADFAFRKMDYDRALAVAKEIETEFKDNASAQSQASTMIKRVEFEKNRQAAPLAPVKPISTQP